MAKKVLLVFGGESTEHNVSIMSAKNIYDSIDWDKFKTTLCYITKHGQYRLVDDIENLDDGREIIPILGEGKFQIVDSDEFYTPDVMLPALHGQFGEDGLVQGLAKLMHIPIAGCGVESSAICMNKLTSKRLLKSAGVEVAPYVAIGKSDEYPTFSELSKELGRTMFVKPPCQGSSVGISKVVSAVELKDAFDLAFKYDNTVLIEKAIKGRELEVAVLGNYPDVKISEVGEVIPGEEFYNYQDKYSADSQSQIVIPADITGRLSDDIRKIAKLSFEVLGCRGMARIDFFIDSKNIYVNEVNTIPGFTNNSMYPKLWENSGLTYTELITKLIESAL